VVERRRIFSSAECNPDESGPAQPGVRKLPPRLTNSAVERIQNGDRAHYSKHYRGYGVIKRAPQRRQVLASAEIMPPHARHEIILAMSLIRVKPGRCLPLAKRSTDSVALGAEGYAYRCESSHHLIIRAATAVSASR
jgi:hypothetical protein